MKDIEETPVIADQVSEVRHFNLKDPSHNKLNSEKNKENNTSELCQREMHDGERKQYQGSMRRVSNEVDKPGEINGINPDDTRYVKKHFEGFKRPNSTKRYSYERPDERRMPAGGKYLVKSGRKRKHNQGQYTYTDNIEPESEFSEDLDQASYSDTDASDDRNSPIFGAPGNEKSRGENRTWKPRYQDTWQHDERQKRAGKKRQFHRRSYEHGVPSYSPYFGEMGAGRYYHLRSPLSQELHFNDMLGQMLHKQDSMLMKLDTIVGLLQKTVKVLSTSPNPAQRFTARERNLLYEQQTRPAWKRAREYLSDTELEGDVNGPRQLKKSNGLQDGMSRSSYGRSMNSNEYQGFRRFSADYENGKEMRPKLINQNSNGIGRIRDDTAPKISSYYSMQKGSAKLGQGQQYCVAEKEGNGRLGRRASLADGTNVNFGQPVSRNNNVEYVMSPEETKANTGEETSLLDDDNEDVQLADSVNDQVKTSDTGQFVEDRGDTTYIVSPGYTNENQQTKETQRSLKMNGRPSMVDLSQTSNMIMPQKYYTIASEGYGNSSNGLELVENRERPLYGEEAIACVYQGHAWQSHEYMDTFKDTFSPQDPYRRRESNEQKKWLARTFTTGSGHSEDFPRSMVTNGEEASNLNQNGAKASLTDNKKMMSSITHLILSSIDVSSEIVQILVATPSDHNSNKDQSRKSMERILNQSLAFCGSLPLIAEIDLSVVQKIYQSSKNCMSFIYRLMDNCYTREELMRCRVAGGVRRYRGNNTETEQLCPKRLRTVLKLASDLFPNEYMKLSKANMIRNNINMKCRKTVIRDVPN